MQPTTINGYRWGLSEPVMLSSGIKIIAMGTASFSVSNPSMLDGENFTEQADSSIFNILNTVIANNLKSESSPKDIEMYVPEIVERIVPIVNEQLKQYGVTMIGMNIMGVRSAD